MSETKETKNIENTLTFKLCELAKDTASICVVDSTEKEYGYISTELLPIFKATMFKKFLMENGFEEEDKDWFEIPMFEYFDKLLTTKEYGKIIQHEFYPFFSETVDAFIEKFKEESSKTNILLETLKDFTEGFMHTLNTINEVLDSTDKDTMAVYLENIVSLISNKLENFSILLN